MGFDEVGIATVLWEDLKVLEGLSRLQKTCHGCCFKTLHSIAIIALDKAAYHNLLVINFIKLLA